MNGPDHYREAERLLDEATSRGDFNPRAQWCLELAKLHTALAHVAATAQGSGGREWAGVADRRFCDMSLALHEQAKTTGPADQPQSLSVTGTLGPPSSCRLGARDANYPVTAVGAPIARIMSPGSANPAPE
jgi:hypothetical protein